MLDKNSYPSEHFVPLTGNDYLLGRLTLSLKKRLPLFGAAFGLGLIVMVVASL
jgi:hypothetical protein